MKSGGWSTLIIMCLAVFVICFDATFMNVSIQNLIHDLDTTLPFVQSMIAIYSLTMACLILPGAKLQDIIGRKETFILGVAVYGIGALISTLSINDYMLLVGWSFLEGIGAALMMPATVAFLTAAYEDEEDRTFAFGVWSGVVALGAILGPLIGGILTTFYTWRYGFAMEILIIAVMLIYSRKLLKLPAILTWKDLDIWGAVLSVSGIFLLVLGILELNQVKDWYSILYIIIPAIILLAAFLWWQKRRIKQGLSPLLDINLFHNRAFSSGTSIKIIHSIGFAGVIFVVPVFILTVMNGTALVAGLSIVIPAIPLIIVSLLVSRITKIIKPAKVISLGFIMAIAGSLLLSYSLNLESTLWDVIPGMIIITIGIGLVGPVSTNIVMTAAGDKEADASGVVNVAGDLGNSLGTAIIGIILILGTLWGLQVSVEDQLPGKYSAQEIKDKLPVWYDNYSKASLSVFRTDRIAEKSVVGRLVDETVRKSMVITFYSIAIVFFLGLISSLFLWRRKEEGVK